MGKYYWLLCTAGLVAVIGMGTVAYGGHQRHLGRDRYSR